MRQKKDLLKFEILAITTNSNERNYEVHIELSDGKMVVMLRTWGMSDPLEEVFEVPISNKDRERLHKIFLGATHANKQI